MKILYTPKPLLRFFSFLFLLISQAIFSQATIPFNCDHSAYLFQYNDVYAVNLASGSSFLVAQDVVPGKINATGYNPKDGYMWGALSEPDKGIVKIGKDFATDIYTFPELSSNNQYIGDISQNGVYYLKPGGTTVYRLDLDPASATYMSALTTITLSANISIHDWAFNANDNQLYTVEKATNILYRVNPDTGALTNLGEVPILSGNNYTYGAVYFDVDGNFYVSANQTGTIYMIQAVHTLTGSNTMNSNLFAYGPSSASNDGARCPTAPVPMEDCSNGVDDDGDGLSDCDDPSCSGVAACPVITPASSGNNGGLESNNRLSDQIRQRNYQRAKSNYKFDATKAKPFVKKKAKALGTSAIELSDFIPVDVLPNTTAIESSPADLLAITNASQVISVDYQRAGQTTGVLLALKTEDKVYEHTKFICDRLLGAELLSVSTMHINDMPFLKSIIKNPEGGIEFVASFSARLTDSDTNFTVESHWNLDKYQGNTGYYNFQIWASSMDELTVLAQEVLRLLAEKKPIGSYINSTPPPVYVKSASYFNGILTMDIINAMGPTTIVLDGGKRPTETSTEQSMATTFNLPNYLNTVTYQTGPLFDFGFRISNVLNRTPDDLFVSDGTWGYDAPEATSAITSYNVSVNQEAFAADAYPIARDISLQASTSEHVSVHRSLTPRFSAVDLSDFTHLAFKASGSGALTIRIVEKGVSNWEDQIQKTITLQPTENQYILPISEFTKASGVPIIDKITMLNFTLPSSDGSMQQKTLDLSQIQFLRSENALSTPEFEKQKNNNVYVVPNPVKEQATFYFYTEYKQIVDFKIYNSQAKTVYKNTIQAQHGFNSHTFSREGLSPGVYIYAITLDSGKLHKGKVIITD